MKQPLISCIVPVFNGERYLAEALNSILAQTYRSLEIIVADDGSTDATAALVASYGDRVRYVWQPNTGPAAARNLGLSVVQGELVAFLDQDDLWHPEKLERQTARFVPGLELDACVTHVQPFWIPELRHAASQSRDHRLTRALPGYLTGTLLARPSLFETVGLFDTALRYGDAMDWFLRAADHGVTIELLPDVLMYHRIHHNNFSRLHASASGNEFLHILKQSLDRRRRVRMGMPLSYKFSRSDCR